MGAFESARAVRFELQQIMYCASERMAISNNILLLFHFIPAYI